MADTNSLQSENLEQTHPGAKEELQDKGLSVYRISVNIRQSIDGGGEQTFMKNSKTTGTAMFFSSRRYINFTD